MYWGATNVNMKPGHALSGIMCPINTKPQRKRPDENRKKPQTKPQKTASFQTGSSMSNMPRKQQRNGLRNIFANSRKLFA